MIEGGAMDAKTILRKLAELPDEELLARLVWGEARGEFIEGKMAVANVVMNRVKSGKYGGKGGVKGVVLKPWQFSCFNANDPNLGLMLGPFGGRDAPIFNQCLTVAKIVLGELCSDNTLGATHYFNPDIVPGGWPASWDRSRMMRRPTIGRHQFYREMI